ncbi:MAG: response regulator [Desulfobacterium sp.]|nr:response regulator [Desulfobacterium sp.]MBU3949536.1 response regulator [Pseudomonadota bacterium]MBU4009978.1 response regulator [Pseudomonadota bacterium]MBU4035686.1 response regulator [Pseudomonadota bacterium]
MTEENIALKEKCSDLERQLEEIKKETQYYKKLSEETGIKRLREIHELSKLIEEYKKSKDILQESEEKYKNLIELSPDPIVIIQNDHFQLINPAYTKLFGYTQQDITNGLSVYTHIREEDKAEVKILLEDMFYGEKAAPLKPVINLIAKDETIITCETSSSVINFNGKPAALVFARDITDREKSRKEKAILETKLKEARKIEAIATLAGGIAHEFNNALFTVSGSVELLQMVLPVKDNYNKYIEIITNSVRRMASLTDKLLAYAQGGKYQAKPISLCSYIEDTLPFIRSTIDRSIKVERNLPKELPEIMADITQMQLVISAIMTNSSEAIEGKGCIRISVNQVSIDNKYIRDFPHAKPGDHLCLTIEDDGKGMDEEILSRIFDPFFSTKFQGRGLGMAAVYGIIRNHNGWVTVDSKSGKGTSVHIYLPVIENQTRKSEKPDAKVYSGKGTILIVEDEEIVLNVYKQMLKKFGYKTIESKTGGEAINIMEQYKESISLVLLDIGLQDMTGGNVFSMIRKINPNQKVVVCSGYSIDGPVQKILDEGANGFLQKPFSLAVLNEKVKAVLAD